MPQKAKRKPWRPKKRRGATSVDSAAAPAPTPAGAAGVPDVPGVRFEKVLMAGRADERLDLFAHLAWSDDYKPILWLEAELNGATEEVQALASGYRGRQLARADADAQEAYEASVLRISTDKERQRRERNRKYVGFGQAIKSVNNLAESTSHASWITERSGKRVVGYDYALRMVQRMVDLRPEPTYPDNEHVDFFVCDQTYATAGGGHGAGSSYSNGVGRFDDDGNPIRVQREVYVNTLDVQVQARDCVLSEAARELIERRGPYTNDFARVLPILSPDRSELFMGELLLAACSAVSEALKSDPATTDDPESTNITERALMLALLGRTPGLVVDDPARMTPLPPLMNVDTNKISDGVRILGNYEKWSRDEADRRGKKTTKKKLVTVALGDGQTCLTFSYVKRRWPQLYKHVLIGNGHWHSSGHHQLCTITMLAWKAFYGGLAERLERTPVEGGRKGRIWESMKNLENNSHMHTQQLAYISVVATFHVILNYVKSPPPSLFLSNPILWISLLGNASAVVMVQALRHVGLPTQAWHRAARNQDGVMVNQCHALAWHHYRATHKTKSQLISIIHLITMYGTHPELLPFLLTSQSGVLRTFAQYYDKINEKFNDFQKERNVGNNLMSALHMTPALPALRHVQHTYRASQQSSRQAAAEDDGVRHSMPNEIKVAVAYLKEKLGTDDLSADSDLNYFWHTGQGRRLADDTHPEHRFWDYVERVATGRSVPKGCATARSWRETAEHQIKENMFFM